MRLLNSDKKHGLSFYKYGLFFKYLLLTIMQVIPQHIPDPQQRGTD